MSEHVYLLTLAAFLATIIAVARMRFIQATAVAKANAAHTDAYRNLASDAVTAQAGNAATLSAIQSELTEIKMRMASVEKILKAVE